MYVMSQLPRNLTHLQHLSEAKCPSLGLLSPKKTARNVVGRKPVPTRRIEPHGLALSAFFHARVTRSHPQATRVSPEAKNAPLFDLPGKRVYVADIPGWWVRRWCAASARNHALF